MAGRAVTGIVRRPCKPKERKTVSATPLEQSPNSDDDARVAGAPRAHVASAAPVANMSVAWAPQPGPQSALLQCPTFEVLYGGARGGGKTDAMLGEWAVHASKYGSNAIGLFVRREFVQLSEAIERAQQICIPLGAKWLDSKATLLMPGGARLKFAHLDSVVDAQKYQGHNYTRIYVEELTNFPDQSVIMRLMATLRSAAGVPCRFRATANPGGPGHSWVKLRYIDPAPHGYKEIKDETSGLSRVFIPAKLSDNKLLTQSDPTYEQRLKASGPAELVRAWLNGDWDVVEGSYFSEWNPERHVIHPFEVPAYWMRFVAMDWGSAKPFSVGWYAVSDGSIGGVPAGALVRYREWYGAKAPNVGLKLTAEQVGEGIRSRCLPGETISYWVCDPAMKAQDGGPSLAERMGIFGLNWFGADNRRLPGWDQVRQRLIGDENGPQLLVFKPCVGLIRTIPGLQHDPVRMEDLDSRGEDHAADELRYACMSRPWGTKTEKAKGPKWQGQLLKQTRQFTSWLGD